jgi:hypothetical protein
VNVRIFCSTAAVVAILASGGAALAFFSPTPKDNPVGRPHTCAVLLTWDTATPDTVNVTPSYQVGTIAQCMQTAGLAGAVGATVLVRTITAPVAPLQPPPQ